VDAVLLLKSIIIADGFTALATASQFIHTQVKHAS